MLKLILCLSGVFIILVLNEFLAKSKILKTSELRRKFVHILVGLFVATWPWLISWDQIVLIGLLMAAVVFINRHLNIFKFNQYLNRHSGGDYFFALAIALCGLLTANKVFFAIAILQLALADGLAAVAGQRFGRKMRYNVFGQVKTVIGSMSFWLISVCILGIGVLLTNNIINFDGYVILLVFLPPLLTIIENLGVMGLDNLLIPVATLSALHFAAML